MKDPKRKKILAVVITAVVTAVSVGAIAVYGGKIGNLVAEYRYKYIEEPIFSRYKSFKDFQLDVPVSSPMNPPGRQRAEDGRKVPTQHGLGEYMDKHRTLIPQE